MLAEGPIAAAPIAAFLSEAQALDIALSVRVALEWLTGKLKVSTFAVERLLSLGSAPASWDIGEWDSGSWDGSASGRRLAIEHLLRSSREGVGPFESRKDLVGEGRQNVESLFGVSGGRRLPVESLALFNVAGIGRLPVEWTGAVHVISNSRLPVEILLDSVGAGRGLVESRVSTEVVRVLPFESLAGVLGDSRAGVEWASEIAASGKLPLEFGGEILVVANGGFPIELLGSLNSGRVLPAEWAGQVSVSSVSTFPIELLKTTKVEKQFYRESQLVFTRGGRVAYEWMLINRRGVQAPVEWVFSTRGGRVIPFEWQGSALVGFGGRLPVEWRLDSRLGSRLGAEWNLRPASGFRLPVEVRREGTRVGRLAVETQLRGFRVENQPVEWLVQNLGVSRSFAVELLLEARRRAPLPVEYDGLSLFVEGNPYVIDELLARSFVISLDEDD